MSLVLNIHDGICIVAGTELQAKQAASHLGAAVHLVPAAVYIEKQLEVPFRPIHLTAVQAFCETLSEAMENKTPDTAYVIYTGSDDAIALMQTCLLVGAYLMLRVELELDAVVHAFQSVRAQLATAEVGALQYSLEKEAGC